MPSCSHFELLRLCCAKTTSMSRIRHRTQRRLGRNGSGKRPQATQRRIVRSWTSNNFATSPMVNNRSRGFDVRGGSMRPTLLEECLAVCGVDWVTYSFNNNVHMYTKAIPKNANMGICPELSGTVPEFFLGTAWDLNWWPWSVADKGNRRKFRKMWPVPSQILASSNSRQTNNIVRCMFERRPRCEKIFFHEINKR